MKKPEPECIVIELVRANTAAFEAVIGQVVDLIAVTNQLLRQAEPLGPIAAATKRVSVSPGLLAELSGEPIPAREGVPPGVRQQHK